MSGFSERRKFKIKPITTEAKLALRQAALEEAKDIIALFKGDSLSEHKPLSEKERHFLEENNDKVITAIAMPLTALLDGGYVEHELDGGIEGVKIRPSTIFQDLRDHTQLSPLKADTQAPLVHSFINTYLNDHVDSTYHDLVRQMQATFRGRISAIIDAVQNNPDLSTGHAEGRGA